MEFMPEHAPLVALTFMGTVFSLGLMALIAVVGLWLKKKWVAAGATVLALLLVSAYSLVLLGVSLTSHQKVLAPGERKYFCAIDCHLAYSIADVEESKALGNGPHQITAAGRFVVIRLRTWFDPSTISPHRGNGPLAPGERRVVLVDDAGHEFAPSAQAKAALAELRGPSAPLSQPLRPGESYVTDLVFDLPAAVRNPRLLVGDQYWIDHFLIGHEDSFLHPKIYLALASSDAISAGRVP